MTSGLEADCMADSQKYYDCGKPTLIQGGWQRAGAGNAYVEFQESTTRISTLDFVPTGHPNNIKVTGIASKTLEVSALALRNDNYIIEAYGWQANGAEFNVGDSYDKLGIMFRFQDNSDITPSDVEVQELGEWKHSLRKLCSATETIQSGNTIYANGQPITTYMLKGNEEHTGTPSPQNPVMPNGVGNKTANLFTTQGATNGKYIDASGNEQTSTSTVYQFSHTDYLKVEPNTAYTFSLVAQSKPVGTNHRIIGYNSNKVYIEEVANLLVSENEYGAKEVTFTTSATCAYITINYVNNYYPNTSDNDIMLNTGSTAKPYEPSGYKIPILTAQQTIDIYIGDLPLLKSLDGTAVDEISNGTLTRRVDSDGSVLPAPITTQITMPSIPTTEGANSITVDTTVQPSEFTATWTGWHDSSVQEYQGGVGNQKFDKSTAAIGYRVLYTTGEIGELPSAFCSDFIPVVPNTTYTLNVVGNLAAKTGHLYALYDSDKEFVDTGTHASVSGKYVYTFTIPSGIAYIRFNGLITNIDDTMLNEGETALPYEPYEYGWV